MNYVRGLRWKKGITLKEFVDSLGETGFQGTELARASEVIVKMKKENAKIFLSFTSNMVTSGLRDFFAQCIEKKMCNAIVTTTGAIEEDIMRSHGEKFILGSFHSDDVKNYENGMNRVGNLFITNETYSRFESEMAKMLEKAYKKKKRWAPSELLAEFGSNLSDENSILFQAAKNNVPVFCPAITDGSLGFHLYFFQQEHPDFVVDPVLDFSNLLNASSLDEKKGLISLGGGVSKHHAILGTLLKGGLDYAIYMTTASSRSGSMSGATTQEAKSWGKIKDDSEASTVIGDVTITFPLAMMRAMEELEK